MNVAVEKVAEGSITKVSQRNQNLLWPKNLNRRDGTTRKVLKSREVVT